MTRRIFSPVALLLAVFLVACTTESDEGAEKTQGDVALVLAYAGTYAVDSVMAGAHTRRTIVIGTDGGIDFDTGLIFAPATYMGVYDRLFVTDSYGGPRIQVEINPVGTLPQRRFRLFVDTAAGELTSVAWYPDANSDAGTVVRVSRAPL